MTREDLIGLSPLELQAMIVPPSEPPRVSMFPETEGWIWVGLSVLAALAWIAIKWIRHRRANAYRRAALSLLSTTGDNAGAISAILRRAALVAYPRESVAALHGERWLRFLDKTRGKPGFETEIGQKMLQAPYLTDPVSVAGLHDLAVDWVRHHKAGVPE